MADTWLYRKWVTPLGEKHFKMPDSSLLNFLKVGLRFFTILFALQASNRFFFLFLPAFPIVLSKRNGPNYLIYYYY